MNIGAPKAIGLATVAVLLVIDMTVAELHASEEANPDGVAIVRTAEELVAALGPQSAGQHIRVLRGDYGIDRPLTVPDGTTLEGEGIMRVENGLPAGFEPGTETTIRVTTGFEGDLLTLGHGVILRGLRLEDLESAHGDEPRRSGNVIVVGSRASADTVAATIRDCEILSPNGGGVGPDGPVGHALVVFTRNPGRHEAPPPHVAAAISARLERSVVRARGSALFAINFAAGGTLAIALEGNRIEGALAVAGGVGRPDEVSEASVTVESRENLYVLHPGGYDEVGWAVLGGSSSHIPNLGAPGAHHNFARIRSVNDRIEGFKVGIRAIGGRRWLSASGPVSDNRVELDLHGTRIRTEGEARADLSLHGALSEETPETGREFPAGDRNVLRVMMRDVTGSPSPRPNHYTHVFGPALEANRGDGNRLEFAGSPEEFTKSNSNFVPPPPVEFFQEGNEAQ